MLGLSAAPAAFDLGGMGALNIDPGLMLTVGLSLDSRGERSFLATVPAVVVGTFLYSQALSQDLSNALVVRFSN